MNRKKLLVIIGLGFLLKLFLAGTTVHSDLTNIFAGEFLFFKKGVINIYDYLATAPESDPLVKAYGRSFFTYPPLAYFTLGILNFIFSFFLSQDCFDKLLNGPISFWGKGYSFDLLVLKLPYLFFDILTLLILVNLFKKRENQRRVLTLWWLNPITLYSSYMVGQFDIIPVFLVVFSILAFQKNHKALGVVSLGLGGGLKMFPLFFVFPYAFLSARTIIGRLKLIFIAGVSYFLTIAPFLSSPAFKGNVLFSNQSQKMLFAQISVSGAEGVYLSIFLFFLIVYFSFYEELGKARERIWYYCLLILLAFFSTTHYHPQWFLWITPFLIINLIETEFKNWLIILSMFFSWLGITLLFEPSLSVGLFAPINPQLANSQGLASILPVAFDAFKIKSLLRSLFAACSLFLVLFSFKNANKSPQKLFG